MISSKAMFWLTLLMGLQQKVVFGQETEQGEDDCTIMRQVYQDMGCSLPDLASNKKNADGYCGIKGVHGREETKKEAGYISIIWEDWNKFECDADTFILPESIGKLKNLKTLKISLNVGKRGNKDKATLVGTIPSSLGSLFNLEILDLSNNNLTGRIPREIGNLNDNDKFRELDLSSNLLTGAPESLIKLRPRKRKLFPNPMTNVPYDLFVPENVGDLSRTQLSNFLSAQITLASRKRQQSSSQYTLQQLLDMCPLNKMGGAEDIKAGCLGGIYFTCYGKTNLGDCYRYYDLTFSNSIYKDMAPSCPSWRSGNFSAECDNSVKKFPLGSGFRVAADFFREVIFGSPVYAPCYPDRQSCKWRSGTKMYLPEGREITA
jgi:hypothetical protein